MPPAQSDEPNESFAVGVKDLFESYEDALLPVNIQLQKFKCRDLYTSHFHRTSCKVFGPRKHVRKVHLVDTNPFDEHRKVEPTIQTPDSDITLPSYYAKHQPTLKKQETNVASPFTSEINDHKSWVEQRKKLRSDLDHLGLNASWLERKPEKTALEESVLNRHFKIKERNKSIHTPTSTSQRNLRYIPINIKISLKKVCQCMKDHHISMEDVFPSVDFTNNTSIDVFRDGLNTLVQMDTIIKSEADDIYDYFSTNSHLSLYHVLDVLLNRNHQQSSQVPSISEEKAAEISSNKETLTDPDPKVDRQKVRLQEYQTALRLCEEKGLVLNEALLRKALLIPGDLPRISTLTTSIRQPGNCLPKDFWKAQHRSNLRRKMSLYKAHRKTSKDSEDSFALFDTESNLSLESGISEQMDIGHQSSSTLTSSNRNSQRESSDTLTSSSIFGESGSFSNTKDSSSIEDESNSTESTAYSGIGLKCSAATEQLQSEHCLENKITLPKFHTVSQQLLQVKKRKASPSTVSESHSSGRKTPNEPNVVIFPRLRDVAPERHQMNLSTGRATISRKVDCWLTFEEYEKITSSMEPVLWREHAIPNAFWPGHLLDKLRLCLSPCNTHRHPKCDAAKSKNTVFHNVKQMSHNWRRSNYGYDNNIRTWPNDGKYIKYGNVDQDKVYRL